MITARVKAGTKYSRRICGTEEVSFELSLKGQSCKMKKRSKMIKAGRRVSAKVQRYTNVPKE